MTSIFDRKKKGPLRTALPGGRLYRVFLFYRVFVNRNWWSPTLCTFTLFFFLNHFTEFFFFLLGNGPAHCPLIEKKTVPSFFLGGSTVLLLFFKDFNFEVFYIKLGALGNGTLRQMSTAPFFFFSFGLKKGLGQKKKEKKKQKTGGTVGRQKKDRNFSKKKKKRRKKNVSRMKIEKKTEIFRESLESIEHLLDRVHVRLYSFFFFFFFKKNK